MCCRIPHYTRSSSRGSRLTISAWVHLLACDRDIVITYCAVANWNSDNELQFSESLVRETVLVAIAI